jgi:hypothetical protein
MRIEVNSLEDWPTDGRIIKFTVKATGEEKVGVVESVYAIVLDGTLKTEHTYDFDKVKDYEFH